MAGRVLRAVGARGRRLPRQGCQSHSFEQLEPRAYLAAVSITGPVEVNEAAKTTQFVVRLSEAVAVPVTVSYSLQSTLAAATYGRDYTLVMGRTQLKPTGSFTFAVGETSQVVTMNLTDDSLREGDERLAFALHTARNAIVQPQSRVLRFTIKDNDNYTVSVVGPTKIQAGTTGDYRLQLSSPATRQETFFVSTREGSGNASQGEPLLERVPVTILPGRTSASFSLATVVHPDQERERSVVIDVAPSTAGFPAPTPFIVTIPAPLRARPPEALISDITATEGAAGTSKTVNFVITLNTPWSQPVSITYATADGTAAAGSDYRASSGTVTFATGETSKLVSVTVFGDPMAEPDETFRLNLSNPVNVILAQPTATVTITDDDRTPEPPFKINVVFPDNSLNASQRKAFVDAAARWSEIIVGDVPDQRYRGRIIDDLEITAKATSLDGPGKTLAHASPEEFRSGSFIPFLGSIEFDIVDLAMLASTGTLTAVITHEMGHVLGIGSLWEFKNLLAGIGTTNPVYVGAHAVREYGTLSGTSSTSVPLENAGGPGTDVGHWRESVFKTELMTGYTESSRVPMPISRVTVGSLHDLGYAVNYAAADPFSLGVRGSALESQRTATATGSRSIGSRVLASDAPPLANVFAAAGTGSFGATPSSTVNSRSVRPIGAAFRT